MPTQDSSSIVPANTSRDGRMYFAYRLLRILAWPFLLIGGIGAGGSIPIVMGNTAVNDPARTNATFGLIVGLVIFGIGYGVRKGAEIIALRHFSPRNIFKLACFHQRAGRGEATVTTATSVLERDETFHDAYLIRALGWMRQLETEPLNKDLRRDKAEGDLKSYLEHHKTPVPYYLLACVAIDRKESDQARQLLTEALSVAGEGSFFPIGPGPNGVTRATIDATLNRLSAQTPTATALRIAPDNKEMLVLQNEGENNPFYASLVEGTANLRIVIEPKLLLGRYSITVNGEKLCESTMKAGSDHNKSLPTGKHEVTINHHLGNANQTYQVTLTKPANYEIRPKYSRRLGIFKPDPNFRML